MLAVAKMGDFLFGKDCRGKLDDSAELAFVGCEVEQDDACSAFVNKTGAQVIAPQFTSAQPFSDGLSAVTVNGKCGFIDENGDWAFSPVYNNVRSFSGGFGWGEMNGLWYILEY